MDRSSFDKDKAKKRLVCLETESSICLSFDKSFSPDSLKLLSMSAAQLGAYGRNTAGDRLGMTKILTSSESRIVPRIQEIDGSSDSQLQQHQQQQQGFAKWQLANEGAVAGASDFSINSDSLNTADMAYTGDVESFFGQSTGSRLDTELDRELQAAVDLMLQGSAPPTAPERAYGSQGRALNFAVPPAPRSDSASTRGSNHYTADSGLSGGGSGSGMPRRRAYYSALHTTRFLRMKLAERFSRGSSNASNATVAQSGPGLGSSAAGLSPSYLSLSDRETAVKRKIGGSADESCEKRARTDSEVARQRLLEPTAPPAAWIPRFLHPVLRYVQQRPLRALGVVLCILVVFLVLIIVILVIGVFPFLMRTTLQDFSLTVTSLHAMPPPEVARALSVDERSLVRPQLMALHEARVANENLGPALQPRRLSEPPLLLFVEDDSRHHSPSSAALPVSSAVGHSSVASRPAGTFVPLLRSGPPGSQALRQATLQPAALATSAQPSAAILKSAEQDEVVTVVSELVSTVHVQRGPFVPAATPAPGPGVPILGPAPVPARAPVWAPVPDSGPKTLDSAGSAASTTYMMQVAGNLTSGGPIGVNIEFTEPLHLLWRDMVVGVIRFPESIHVPGRGTTQWRWPPFEVAIPANGTRLVADDRVLRGPPSDEQIHPGSNQVNGIAQRRVMGASGSAALGRSGQEPDDLASWFAAIQAHRPFTMHWRSRVKVSAMGMHASNIKFEKSVRVLCDETQGCSIDNSPFTV